MNGQDMRRRLAEIEARHDAGVALFPDDYEFLLYLAKQGLRIGTTELHYERDRYYCALQRIVGLKDKHVKPQDRGRAERTIANAALTGAR